MMVAPAMQQTETQFNRLLNHHFEFRSIRADRLRIDREYQRILDETHYRKIAREFDPKAFGVLFVSERSDGSLYVIDGQHRLQALRELNSLDEMVPCHVYRGLTRQDEAFIFEMGTNRKAISPIDRFRAKLFAGDPDTIRIAEILRRRGYQISHTNGVKAAGAVERIYKGSGPQRLDLIFDLIEHSLGVDHEYVPASSLILGLNAFLVRYETRYDRSRLINVINQLGAEKITQKATAVKELMRESLDSASGRVILSAYNSNLRTNRLPDWDSFAPASLGQKSRRTARGQSS